MRIPRVFHRIWLGPHRMPREFVKYGRSWAELHPGWEHVLWTDQNLFSLKNQEYFMRAKSYSEKSDFLRHEILLRYGGVYIDTDFEALRCIEPLIDNADAFAASEREGIISMGILGCVPNHSAFRQAVDALGEPPFPRHPQANENTGPGFITRIWRMSGYYEKLLILPSEQMYPLPFAGARDFGDPYEAFPEAYAIHHWAHSWK